MYTCRCSREGLRTEDIYQCWQAHIPEDIWNNYGLKDGEIVCGHCYCLFNPDGLMTKHKHLDPRPKIPVTLFTDIFNGAEEEKERVLDAIIEELNRMDTTRNFRDAEIRGNTLVIGIDPAAPQRRSMFDPEEDGPGLIFINSIFANRSPQFWKWFGFGVMIVIFATMAYFSWSEGLDTTAFMIEDIRGAD